MRLTEAGQALLGHAERMLSQAAVAEAELEAIAGLRGGRIRLASFPTAGAAIVPPVVSRFIDGYPQIELSVVEAEPEESLHMLRASELEVALVAERLGDEGAFGHLYEGIHLDHLLDEPMYVLLCAAHALAHRRRLRMEDLADEVWIELGRNPSGARRRVHVAASGAAGLEPRIRFQSDDVNVVQGMVAAGAGVALVPELALANVREDVVARHLGRSAPVRSVAAATLAGTHRSPATDALLSILHDVSNAHVAGRRNTRSPTRMDPDARREPG